MGGLLGFFAPLAITAGLDLVAAALNRTPAQHGSRLKNKAVNSDALGQAYPRCRGTVRLQGKLIQAPRQIFEATHKTVSGGIFGIGQQSQYFYSYAANPAYSFGKKLGGGPAAKFLRLWYDGKLIYNAKISTGSITPMGSGQFFAVAGPGGGVPAAGNQAGSTTISVQTGASCSVVLNVGYLILINGDTGGLSYIVQNPFTLGPNSTGTLAIWPPLDIDIAGGIFFYITLPGLNQPFYDPQAFETWAQMEAAQGVTHISHITGDPSADLPGSINFHLGLDSEQPDALSVLSYGQKFAVGYRGLPYIQVRRLKLTQLGSNHIGSMTAEIAFDNPPPQYPKVGPIAGVAVVGSYVASLLPYNAGGGQRLPYVFIINSNSGTTTIYRVNTTTNALEASGTINDNVYSAADIPVCDEDGFIYFVGQASLGGGAVPLYKYDGQSMQLVGAWPVIGLHHQLCLYDTVTTDLRGFPVLKKMIAYAGDGTLSVFQRDGAFGPALNTAAITVFPGIQGLTANNDGQIWVSMPDGSLVEVDGTFGPWVPAVGLTGNPTFVQLPPSLAVEKTFTISGFGVLSGGQIFYSLDDDSVIIFDGSGPTLHVNCTTGLVGSISLGGYASSLYPDFGTYIQSGNGRQFYRVNLSNFVTGGTPVETSYLLDNWFGGASTSAAFGNYDAPTHSVWVVVGGNLYRIYLDRALGNSVGLDLIVASILNEAGYSPSDYDVTQLGVIGVDGVEFDQETYEQDIKRLQEIYPFDWAESDGKLIFVLRSNAATVVIPEDDLGALDQPDKYEPRVTEEIQDENDTPRSVWIKFYDETKDLEQATQYDQRILQPYATALASAQKVVNTQQQKVITSPITGTPTQMKQQADIMLADEWIRRPKSIFKLPPKYLQLDATDKRVLSYKGRNIDLNVTEVDRGSALGLEVHAEGHDNSIYSSVSSSSGGLGSGTTTPPPPPPTPAGLTYTISPTYALSEASPVEVDMARVTANWSDGRVTVYSLRSGGSGFVTVDPGAGNSQLYYVTIHDPNRTGDPSSPSLAAFCDPNPANVFLGQPGYVFIGTITITHNGVGVVVTSGGSANVTAAAGFYVNGGGGSPNSTQIDNVDYFTMDARRATHHLAGSAANTPSNRFYSYLDTSIQAFAFVKAAAGWANDILLYDGVTVPPGFIPMIYHLITELDDVGYRLWTDPTSYKKNEDAHGYPRSPALPIAPRFMTIGGASYRVDFASPNNYGRYVSCSKIDTKNKGAFTSITKPPVTMNIDNLGSTVGNLGNIQVVVNERYSGAKQRERFFLAKGLGFVMWDAALLVSGTQRAGDPTWTPNGQYKIFNWSVHNQLVAGGGVASSFGCGWGAGWP